MLANTVGGTGVSHEGGRGIGGQVSCRPPMGGVGEESLQLPVGVLLGGTGFFGEDQALQLSGGRGGPTDRRVTENSRFLSGRKSRRLS